MGAPQDEPARKNVKRYALKGGKTSAPAPRFTIDYAAELNEGQLQAVRRIEKPQLVIAGAGSGKTRTLVYRVAYLVERGIPP